MTSMIQLSLDNVLSISESQGSLLSTKSLQRRTDAKQVKFLPGVLALKNSAYNPYLCLPEILWLHANAWFCCKHCEGQSLHTKGLKSHMFINFSFYCCYCLSSASFSFTIRCKSLFFSSAVSIKILLNIEELMSLPRACGPKGPGRMVWLGLKIRILPFLQLEVCCLLIPKVIFYFRVCYKRKVLQL